MASIASISSLLVPNKTVEVEYPGFPGFVLTLCFMSRESLVSIRKRATKTSFKNRQALEEFDEDLFLKLYVEHTVKGWKGLTAGYLEQLAPVDVSDVDSSSEIEFSADNALALMKASADFDAFISEQVSNLGNFSSNTQKR